MEYLKAEVMEMCHRENLYQIDLLNGSKNRVTEREYWAVVRRVAWVKGNDIVVALYVLPFLVLAVPKIR